MERGKNIDNVLKKFEEVHPMVRSAVSNWIKGCDKSLSYYTGPDFAKLSADQRAILKELCEKSFSYLNEKIVTPLFTWLYMYNQLLKKKIALTKPYPNFVRDGINHIYRYVVILNYFIEFKSFMEPEGSVKKLPEQQKRLTTKANEMKALLYDLVGCDKASKARGTDLSGEVVKVLGVPRDSKVLAPVRDKIGYLLNTCEYYNRYSKLN